MKRKIFRGLVLWISLNIVSLSVVSAQQIFSLEQCVQYALANNEDLKNYGLDEKITNATVEQSKSKYYPQLNGIVDIRDNVKLQTSILPFNPDASPGATKGPTPVQFGTQYNATAAVEANWTVYDPTLKSSIASQKINSEIAKNNAASKELDISINVKKAYYSALYNKVRIKFYEEAVKRSKKFYEDAKVLAENKQIQNLEVSRSLLDYQNQLAELEKSKQAFSQSLLLLKYNMGFPLENPVVLSDSTLLENINTGEALEGFSPEARAEYKNLLLQNNQEQLNIRKTQRGYVPTISLYGYGGSQAFRSDFSIFNFSEKWYGLGYVGVKASIPLFDGFLKKQQVSQSRLNVERRENEKALFVRKFEYEKQNTQIALANSLKNLEIQKNNMQLAKEILQNTIDRYQSGLVLGKEVTDAEYKLIEAQTNYLSRLYDYIVARLDLEKIKG